MRNKQQNYCANCDQAKYCKVLTQDSNGVNRNYCSTRCEQSAILKQERAKQLDVSRLGSTESNRVELHRATYAAVCALRSKGIKIHRAIIDEIANTDQVYLPAQE